MAKQLELELGIEVLKAEPKNIRMPGSLTEQWAAIACLVKDLDGSGIEDTGLASILLYLETAVDMAELYNKRLRSIYWNRSKQEAKLRVWKQLQKIKGYVIQNLGYAIADYESYASEHGLPTDAGAIADILWECAKKKEAIQPELILAHRLNLISKTF